MPDSTYLYLAAIVAIFFLLCIGVDLSEKKSFGKSGYRRSLLFPIIFSDLNEAAEKTGNNRTALIVAARKLGTDWTYEERPHPWLAELTYQTDKGELVFVFPWREERDPTAVSAFYKKMKATDRRKATERLINTLQNH
jgi:hypothetical protein